MADESKTIEFWWEDTELCMEYRRLEKDLLRTMRVLFETKYGNYILHSLARNK